MSAPPEPAAGTGRVVRVVVADDQTVIREALATLLDLMPGIDVVATAANGHEAVEQTARTAPDVVLMDLHMPVLDGTEATRLILGSHPDVAVVVLTTLADDASILGALGAGARGYLTKETGREDIARAIRTAAAGQAVLDPAVQQRLIAAASRPAAPPAPAPAPSPVSPVSPPDGLTPRETEVLRLIAAGLSNQDISERLFVSEATVKTHINNLFAKARLRDRAQAVAYAFQHGLASPED